MAIEVGSVLEGTVTGITKFGAFVDLGNKQTGLVHISEVANEYVENISDFIKEQDKVKVKVLSVDEKGKISLSIKQTQPKPESAPRAPKAEGREPKEFRPRQHDGHSRVAHDGNRRNSFDRKSGGLSFEDKMSRFLKDSEERLTDLKRNTESKRGGRGGRRD
ncbi:S1 domain-containing RNA-binding protein [Veillonella criceti]|uniref:General stress protein 13 n=1 Tax=Veillonella criceti TaxID=103891 RepID=A0A380NLI3_9FIRM|nr:S1 domain-containing RNA-binding protein [Veillonella criceti]SUP42585.1 General stress protein 13 [Veillonella criceti]